MAHEILEGIRVIDWTMYQLGPHNAKILAEMGAEVIKIEPPTGDNGRSTATMPQIIRGGKGKGFGGMDINSYFEVHNRGKKSIVLDLNKPKAKEVLYQLVSKSDVFLQNMRHGVAIKLGFGYEDLKKYNPKLIYCSGNSFGTKGPDATKPGFDISGAARSGWMHMVPTETGEPVVVGISDQVAAMMGAFTIVGALYARERFGIGQACEYSHLNSVMTLINPGIQGYQYVGEQMNPPVPRNRRPQPIFNHYKCADGGWIVLACADNRHWPVLCQAMGLPDSVRDDPRFNNPAGRRENAKECIAILDAAFAKKTRAEWIKTFEGKDIFWEKVQKISDLGNDPQVIANDYMTDYTHPITGATYKYLQLPMKYSETPAMRMGRAPLLGEHTEEILVNILGYKKGDVPKLVKEIGEPTRVP